MAPPSVSYHLGPNPHLRLQAAARRRLHRSAIDRTARDLLSSIDVEGFHRRFTEDPEQQALGGRGSSKYTDLEQWLRVAVERWYGFGFHRLPPRSRLLDIGCGSGFFLLTARQFGHDAVGLDLDLDPLYNAQIEFFDLERVNHLITPADPLPPFEEPFDAVTAFMACFHWDIPSDVPWTPSEWAQFLPALRNVVADDGRVLLWLNHNRVTGSYLTDEVLATVQADPAFRVRAFANCLDLRPSPRTARVHPPR